MNVHQLEPVSRPLLVGLADKQLPEWPLSIEGADFLQRVLELEKNMRARVLWNIAAVLLSGP